MLICDTIIFLNVVIGGTSCMPKKGYHRVYEVPTSIVLERYCFYNSVYYCIVNKLHISKFYLKYKFGAIY